MIPAPYNEYFACAVLVLFVGPILAMSIVWPFMRMVSGWLPAGRGRFFCKIGAHAMRTIDHEYAWRCWVDECKHCDRRRSGIND